MKKIPEKIVEHLYILGLVSIILVAAAIMLEPEVKSITPPKLYNELDFVDFSNPVEQALLNEVLHIYHPENPAHADSIYNSLNEFHSKRFDYLDQERALTTPFTFSKSIDIFRMYLKFILIYILVLGLTFYGVQTLAVILFMHKQQNRPPFLIRIIHLSKRFKHLKDAKSIGWQIYHIAVTLLKGLAKALLFAALFSPAYVTAYSIKSDFNTDSELFLILLAVISNGLLITYTNKFFTLLITESRKGYVLTARVKNLSNSYFPNKKDGIAWKSVFAFNKKFKGHVFQHIYSNARFQYWETIKEQASFLISGLVIIEMALNIHGHFMYELLQQVLYKNYHYLMLMILGIFVLVKLTDIAAEIIKIKAMKKIQN